MPGLAHRGHVEREGKPPFPTALRRNAQFVNFMNPRVTDLRPANDGARREARHPSRPAEGAGEPAAGPGNPPIHASAVNFVGGEG